MHAYAHTKRDMHFVVILWWKLPEWPAEPDVIVLVILYQTVVSV